MLKILITLLSLALLTSCTAQPTYVGITINDVSYSTEKALTRGQHQTGLMYREQLDEDTGMIFVYENEAPRQFWMKNTLIPLDIIYMDSNYEIISIIKDAQPCKIEQCPSYPSKNPAKYVLEINAGQSNKHNFQIGDQAYIISQ